MEAIITRFVAELRREGLRVSPGESLDAVCALAYGGLEGRCQVRSLLRLTLVKNVNDIPAFEKVFKRFFSSYPEGMGVDPADLLDEAIISMEGEAMLGTNPEMVNENMSLAMVEAGLSPEDLKDLQRLKEIDLDQLDGSEMEIRLKGYRGEAGAPRPSMRMPQNPVTMAFKPPSGQKRDVTFSQQELDAMQDAVSRMILRLKKDIRRVKNRENRGKIHVIRTIQKNYRNGMVPFLLELRRKRKQKPRLVVLCDVSFSVSHASQFMLLLLHTLHNRLMDVRSFIFNAELAEITEMLSNSPINTMMKNIDSGEIVNLDDNSDYGKVFLTFKEKYLENLRGRPAVIFLGDARNNYNKANEWVLDQVREKAGYMLWLTPEDRSLWKRGDCLIEEYGAWCDKVEVVKNVEELNLIVEDLFRNLYLEEEHRSMKSVNKVEEDQEYDYRDYYTRGGSGSAPSLDPEGRSHW
ncbi:VWA domain-containing protein [Desulfuromonas sp. TF]|uniref:VWA domain-containing protein n=1 Tax=Desulfuromonas sp. TF TaxID=1232410 RepID=UPI0003F5A50D|nr:VWA domain-containing protein [Desulfuromonas sp. TF]